MAFPTSPAAPLPEFERFKAQALANGAAEVLARQWAPDEVVALHTHPFDAKALVTAGEMWLTCGDHTRHLRVGDTFELARGTPHSERYGPAGATYWVARHA